MEKKESKVKKALLTALRYLVVTVSVAIVFYILFALLFSTQEEKRLSKENHLYDNLYETLKAKEDLIADVVDGLLLQDESIYEELFETEPPSLDPAGPERPPVESDVAEVSALTDSLMQRSGAIEDRFNEVFRLLQAHPDSIPPLSLPLRNMSYVQTGASVGVKHNPVYKLPLQHDGLDLVASQGTPVYAAAAGKVSKVVRSRKGLGNTVEMDHGNGFVTRYCLLGDISVTQGRSVKVGQKIGTVGISSSVSAPHLHFEVYHRGVVRDPVDFFFASLSPEDYSRMRFMAAKTSQSMD